jgi:hypothetical protein
MAKNGKNKKLSRATLAKIEALDPRRQKYLAGRLDGKSKLQAGKDAGFTEGVSRNAAANIENSALLEAMQAALLEVAPVDRLAQKIGEGLDAMETRVISHVLGSKKDATEEVVVEERSYIAWDSRREYIKLALECHGIRKTGGMSIQSGGGEVKILVVD